MLEREVFGQLRDGPYLIAVTRRRLHGAAPHVENGGVNVFVSVHLFALLGPPLRERHAAVFPRLAHLVAVLVGGSYVGIPFFGGLVVVGDHTVDI